jgi:hypothetical protein
MNQDKSFDYFKNLLVRHSLFRPPHNIIVFTLLEIKDITDFYLQNFFKLYNLYLKAFTSKVDIEISTF